MSDLLQWGIFKLLHNQKCVTIQILVDCTTSLCCYILECVFKSVHPICVLYVVHDQLLSVCVNIFNIEVSQISLTPFVPLLFFERLWGVRWQAANLQQSQRQQRRPGCRAVVGGVQGRGNQLLMGNTLLSIAQIVLSTTAQSSGRHPGGAWRPEARHDLKTGALLRYGSWFLWKGQSCVL